MNCRPLLHSRCRDKVKGFKIGRVWGQRGKWDLSFNLWISLKLKDIFLICWENFKKSVAFSQKYLRHGSFSRNSSLIVRNRFSNNSWLTFCFCLFVFYIVCKRRMNIFQQFCTLLKQEKVLLVLLNLVCSFMLLNITQRTFIILYRWPDTATPWLSSPFWGSSRSQWQHSSATNAPTVKMQRTRKAQRRIATVARTDVRYEVNMLSGGVAK